MEEDSSMGGILLVVALEGWRTCFPLLVTSPAEDGTDGICLRLVVVLGVISVEDTQPVPGVVGIRVVVVVEA